MRHKRVARCNACRSVHAIKRREARYPSSRLSFKENYVAWTWDSPSNLRAMLLASRTCVVLGCRCSSDRPRAVPMAARLESVPALKPVTAPEQAAETEAAQAAEWASRVAPTVQPALRNAASSLRAPARLAAEARARNAGAPAGIVARGAPGTVAREAPARNDCRVKRLSALRVARPHDFHRRPSRHRAVCCG